MTYTKKQFLEDVAKEARALREHATKDELSNLDFNSFDPDSHKRCIYGQMTDNCQSLRAAELVHACCTRYFHRFAVGSLREVNMDLVKKRVNGEVVEGVQTASDLHEKRRGFEQKYFSAIEAYIATPFAKNQNLIAFLKGERKDLVL